MFITSQCEAYVLIHFKLIPLFKEKRVGLGGKSVLCLSPIQPFKYSTDFSRNLVRILRYWKTPHNPKFYSVKPGIGTWKAREYFRCDLY